MSGDTAVSRRAQPARQTRTNPSRTQGRSLGGRRAAARDADDDDDEQHDIFPAITHFTDAVTALPRELVRHFTLLKEVDAKIFAPEEALGQMVEAAMNCPLPEPKHNTETIQAAGSVSVNGDAAIITNGTVTQVAQSIEPYDRAAAAYAPENYPRRQLFRQLAFTMQDMLVSLDEKNHVISTATEALDKHMGRLKSVLPYVENEVSEEARWGSAKHWAYAENRIPQTTSERSKREKDNVNALSKAAAEVAAQEARAHDRKQPARDKKGRNQQHAESDFDDHNDGRKGDKRTQGNGKKSRATDAGANGANGPPTKRRKVDKGANGGTAMERQASGIRGSGKDKHNSPRETPIPDQKKRAKPANGQPRKKTAATNAIANTLDLASSPVHGTFADAKAASRASPPTNGRPTTAKARQNSIQSIQDQTRQRPSSSASTRPNGGSNAAVLDTVASINGHPVSEIKVTMKETGVNGKVEHIIEDADPEEHHVQDTLAIGGRKESSLKHEDTQDTTSEPTQGVQQTAVPVPLTTKFGRASKPQTPALGAQTESVRTTSRRNATDNGSSSNKRSHKKGQGQAAAALVAASHENEAIASVDEDEPIAEDEPRYCYCNGVSYGEMVACDADGCAKEWFHLECVGLKVAPKGNGKSGTRASYG